MGKEWIAAGLFLLAACGQGNGDEAGKVGSDNAIELDSIGFPDMEANGMLGKSCAFATPNSIAQLALVTHEAGFLKIGGQVQKFAIVEEKGVTPAGYASDFSGDEYDFSLSLQGEGEDIQGGKSQYDAQLDVRDKAGGSVYSATGYVQCRE